MTLGRNGSRWVLFPDQGHQATRSGPVASAGSARVKFDPSCVGIRRQRHLVDPN
jgi:hypothetical protein